MKVEIPKGFCIHDRKVMYPFLREHGIDPDGKWFIYFDYGKNCYIAVQDKEAAA